MARDPTGQDPITSLLPMQEITVRQGEEGKGGKGGREGGRDIEGVYDKLVMLLSLSLLCQAMFDLTISGLSFLTDLRGLENLAKYGDELSIVNNQQLSTLVHLSANVTSDPSNLLSLNNIGIRGNPMLQDLSGLRLVENVTGKGEGRGRARWRIRRRRNGKDI